MIAVVTGMIATYPVGGVAWDYGQYLIGLEKLGFEVYYIEDTAWHTYDPIKVEYGEDPSYGVQFLNHTLSELSPTLKHRWHFRAMDGRIYGIESRRMAIIIAEADLFLNISGGTVLRDEYMMNQCKIFIDTDPGWNHFVNFPKWDNNPGWEGTHGWRAHDHFFTYAENIGLPICNLPLLGINWLPTRPPVILDKWHPHPPAQKWTTVMTWKNFSQPIEYQGQQYGTKEVEFEVAVGGNNPPKQHLQTLSWSIVDSVEQSKTLDIYRTYIQQSRGEFSVAKNVYVDTHSGWFSCRSICYLASSRPVVVQDTGFSRFISTGEGLFAFDDLECAKSAIEEIELNYSKHQKAAYDVANEYFCSDRVIGQMLKEIGFK